MKKTKLTDLYFGIVLYEGSWSGKHKQRLRACNLFNSLRVLRSVAYWVVETHKSPKFAKEHDFLSWCFTDVRGRAEWEFVVCPWGGLKNDDKVVEVGEKVDTYRMYVEPNAKYLRELVDSVSVSSAKKFLTEERKRYRRVRPKNGA